MAATTIELQDVTRVLSQLVMPSPRRNNSNHQQTGHGCMKHLAPIEMSAQSIHLHQPYHSLQIGPSHSSSIQTASQVSQANIQVPPSISIPIAPDVYKSKAPFIHGWFIPLGYTFCGLCMGLCNLIVPHQVPNCAHLLCPLWTLSLGMHAATETDPLWFWCGVMCVFLLPFVILIRDFLFVAFYLIVFTGFTSGRFWQAFQGPPFILLSVCWAGLLLFCGLSLGSDHPCAQISIAGFFALTAGIISSSRLVKQTLRFG